MGPTFEAKTISTLSYSQRYLKKYAVSETALMQHQRRQRQRLVGVNIVRYSAKSVLARSETALNSIQDFGKNSALSPTALTPHKCSQLH